MAKLIRFPSTGSIYGTAGSVPGSSALGKAIWLGFHAAAGASGSVMWSRGSSSETASPLLPITSCGGVDVFGPFFIFEGVYASMVGGSALYYRE